MSIINLAQHAIDSTPDLELLPAGTEAEVRIVNVVNDTDKNGFAYLMPYFEVLDEPNVDEFSDYMRLPDASRMSEKELIKAKKKLQAFGEAFDIDWSQEVDLESLRGLSGYLIVGVSKPGDYGIQNTVRQYVSGK